MLPTEVPLAFTEAIAQLSPNPYLAALLWQRGIRDLTLIPGFLNAAQYCATPASALGLAMERSVIRLQQAVDHQASIVLCSEDETPSGITTIALLYEALSKLMPDRIHISQALAFSIATLDDLKSQGVNLLITCNLSGHATAALDYAKTIGIDIISIDHHRPHHSNVYAQLNSRQLERSHPFATLPSVAIAYKLVEALGVEAQPLLDLVAIGLLSDFVEFTGDARYLFQISIPVLQAQSKPETATRSGVARLLKHCKTQGDRATDFNSGLGARIRALCQVQPKTCLELLIGSEQAETLADQAELAHVRLFGLHQEVLDQALQMIQGLDLSMHEAIVLTSAQWSVKALPSVANTIAEQFQKPIFLFSTEDPRIATGVARSELDLYEFLQSQGHLVERSDGHPNALNLSLSIENLEMFTQSIQHQLRLLNLQLPMRDHQFHFDLCVTVSDLGEMLFKALRSIEPCGLGNPMPRLLLKNVRFDQVFTHKIKDQRHQPVIYRCAEFKLYDRNCVEPIIGHWWGHGQDELPKGDCHAIVQLENNVRHRRYDVRLVQWFRDARADEFSDEFSVMPNPSSNNLHPMIDRRHLPTIPIPNAICLTTCPSDWTALKLAYRRSVVAQKSLVLDYRLPPESDFKTFLGIAKYLARMKKKISPQQWCDRLFISAPTLKNGLEILRELGFVIQSGSDGLVVSRLSVEPPTIEELTMASEAWDRSLCRERFRQQYFMQVNLSVLQAFLAQSMGYSC